MKYLFFLRSVYDKYTSVIQNGVFLCVLSSKITSILGQSFLKIDNIIICLSLNILGTYP